MQVGAYRRVQASVNPAAGRAHASARRQIPAAGGMRAGALEAPTTARDGRILTARTPDSMLPDS